MPRVAPFRSRTEASDTATGGTVTNAAQGVATPAVRSPLPSPSPTPPAPKPPARPSRGHRAFKILSRLLLLLMLGLLGAVGWWVYTARPWAPVAGPLSASGSLEADEVLVGPEVAGRLVSLVEEGQRVRAGQELARLDDSLIQLQIRQADTAQRLQLYNLVERYQLRSPIDGVVTRVPVHVGEVIAPGQTAVAVADLSRLKLTAYVLERDLGQVQVGQVVSVTADPFPGRTFHGTVTSTNPRAEFTPRNVQTQRDRLNLVFGVKILVENPDGALKPGMPADVSFEPL